MYYAPTCSLSDICFHITLVSVFVRIELLTFVILFFRHYSSAEEETLPEILRECLAFLKSESMFLTLSNLTGLSLHELAPVNSDSDADTPKQDTAEDDGEEGEGASNKDRDEEERTVEISTPKKRQKLNSETTKASDSQKQNEGEDWLLHHGTNWRIWQTF